MNQEPKLLHGPTTDEFLAAVSFCGGGMFAAETQPLIVVVRDLTTTGTKSKSKFATPDDQIFQVDSEQTILLWAEVEDSKRGKTKQDKFYDSLTGEVYRVLDLSGLDYRTHPLIQPHFEAIPKADAERIYADYSLQPTSLLHQLLDYPEHTPPRQDEEEEITEILSRLGTYAGVEYFRNLNSSDFHRLFSTRIVLESEDGAVEMVSWFQKRTGITDPNAAYPTGCSTKLSFYAQPFIAAANRNPHYASAYLSLFALWLYAGSKEVRAGMKKLVSKNDRVFYLFNSNAFLQESWTELCSVLQLSS